MGDPDRLLRGNLEEAYSSIGQLEPFQMPSMYVDFSYSTKCHTPNKCYAQGRLTREVWVRVRVWMTHAKGCAWASLFWSGSMPVHHYNSAQIMAVHLMLVVAIQGPGYVVTLATTGAGKQHLGSAKYSVRSTLNDPNPGHQTATTQNTQK